MSRLILSLYRKLDNDLCNSSHKLCRQSGFVEEEKSVRNKYVNTFITRKYLRKYLSHWSVWPPCGQNVNHSYPFKIYITLETSESSKFYPNPQVKWDLVSKVDFFCQLFGTWQTFFHIRNVAYCGIFTSQSHRLMPQLGLNCITSQTGP